MSSAPSATVRFGRLERRGVLLGLSAGQLTALAGGLVVLVAAEYTAGAVGVLASAPVWVTLAGVALIAVAGRPVVAWLPIVGDWTLRRALRQTVHVTRPLRELSPDALALPGIPGPLDVIVSSANGAAYIVDPRWSTVTAIVEVSGRSFVLEDPGTQDRHVGGWGRVLASLCQQPEVVRVQVLHRTSQGGATKVRRWWASHALADAPWASRVVAELIADAEQVADRQECLLAVAIRLPRAGRRISGATLTAVDQHVGAIVNSLASAGLDVHGWVAPAQLRHVLRTSYDPNGAAVADVSKADDRQPSPMVGPMGVSESWDSVRTDTAHHVVYWVQEWPRSDVHPGFLQPLLLTPGARRSFTLIAEPLPPAKAFREIRRAKVEHTADAAQRARIGRLEDESTRAEAADLVRREQDLVAGHGDLRFAGLVTVSAGTRDELDAACRATEAAAGQAMCELRRLVGQQGQAHAAAALPLARGLL
ncbi:MAG: hypothetical protein LH645_13105 [Actinomycetia bacterium]|nr:hypothetical protein [Actinomycetes bacterium]